MTALSIVTATSLSSDETALMAHILMFGSDGYPVRKVGSRHWAWDYRSLESKVVFPTKREAVASFERFMDDLRARLRAAA